MKSLRLWGLDHLLHVAPADFASFPGGKLNGFSLQTSGLDIANVSANAGDLLMYLNANKRMTYGVTGLASSTKGGFGALRLSSLLGGRTDVKEFTLGFNVKGGFRTGSWSTSTPAFSLYVNAAAPNWGMSVVNLINWPASPTPFPEGYYEFTFFLTGVSGTNRIEVRLDKKLIFTQAVNPGAAYLHPSNLMNNWLVFGNPSAAVSLPTAGQGGSLGDEIFSMGNMYSMWSNEDTDGSTIMGPLEVVPLPIQSTNNPPWVASDGSSVLTVLNTPQRHANVRTPYVITDVGQTAMRAKPNVAGISGAQKILAVQGVTSAWLEPNKPAQVSAKWSHNSVDTTAVVSTPNTGTWQQQVDVPTQLLTTMPDGTPITKAKLAELELVIAAI